MTPSDRKPRVVVLDEERVTIFTDRRGQEHIATSLPWVWGDLELASVLRWPLARLVVDELAPAHVLRLLWHSLRAGQRLRGVPEARRLSLEDVACLFDLDDAFGPLTVLGSIMSHAKAQAAADSGSTEAPAPDQLQETSTEAPQVGA